MQDSDRKIIFPYLYTSKIRFYVCMILSTKRWLVCMFYLKQPPIPHPQGRQKLSLWAFKKPHKHSYVKLNDVSHFSFSNFSQFSLHHLTFIQKSIYMYCVIGDFGRPIITLLLTSPFFYLESSKNVYVLNDNNTSYLHYIQRNITLLWSKER